MRHLLPLALFPLLSACAATAGTTAAPASGAGQVAAHSPAAASEEARAAHLKKVTARSEAIVKALKLEDAAKALAVQGILIDHYCRLQAWQEENDTKLEALKKAGHSPDQALATKAKEDLALLLAGRKLLRDQFLGKLAGHLDAAAVTEVKDQMTYHKVRVTFNAYCAQNPWLGDEEKARIMEWLVEAREDAIDGGSSEEKSDIFNKYKGRINNYLSKRKPRK